MRIRSIRLACAAITCLILVAAITNFLLHHVNFMGEFTRHLPNGYTVFASNATTIAIVPPAGARSHPTHCTNGVAVAARVDRIRIIGHLVVGRVVAAPRSELASIERPGYFILHTTTHELRAGLTEAEFANALRADHGVAAVPRLIRPQSLSVWQPAWRTDR